MKTVLTDNSLCSLPLDDNVRPEHIYKYIAALGEAGIKHVEIDCRTIMKMDMLPDGVNYIFRLSDPRLAEAAELFDFKYVSVNINDLKEPFRIKAPVILELPAVDKISYPLFRFAQNRLEGKVSMVRLKGSYQIKSYRETEQLVRSMKNAVPVPIDVCPMNKYKTALDTAVKFSQGRVDSLTLSMGAQRNFASLEEFVFTMMAVQEKPLKEIDMAALCKAEFYHKLVFGSHSSDGIVAVMKQIDYDIAHLQNVDTGERVRSKLAIKDRMLIRKNYVTALQNFIDSEEIPDDFAYDITEAIRMFDASLYNDELLNKFPNGIYQ